MLSSPSVNFKDLSLLQAQLSAESFAFLQKTIDVWQDVKKNNGKVIIVTGSGPNLHEGVTIQIGSLIKAGLVDGVITSSAVICHELSGVLERVRRVDGLKVGFKEEQLPSDKKIEVSIISPQHWEELSQDTELDYSYYKKMLSLKGPEIIKVAGNMAYPTGLWIERMARYFLPIAQEKNLPLEFVMGLGCDERTMIGACAKNNIPCLVSVTQLVGGGQVGLSVGDSISITKRSQLIAKLLAEADLIIESGVALTQDIHDGPLELFSGHGMWSAYDESNFTFTLKDKTLVRIDLDPQLKKAWEMQRQDQAVIKAIDQGLSKTTTLNIPFRMEMSGFARLPGSLPLLADLGVVWPLLASGISEKLNKKLDFISYKQGNILGESIRNYIVKEIKAFNKNKALRALNN